MAAGKYENCGYIKILMGGGVYYALYDSGATSRRDQRWEKRGFADRLKQVAREYTQSTVKGATC